ncbi:MAG: universal stress protein [Oxalobacter sp.]
MPEKRYVLTATDMSDWAKFAEVRGAVLTRHLGNAEMLLVNVQEQSSLDFYAMLMANQVLTQELIRKEVEKTLGETAKQLSEEEGITVTPIIRTGKVPNEIQALLEEKKASLLVIGAHGQGYHFMPIIGNIPAKLIQGSPCPVLIIRQKEIRPYRRVLIPIDFSEVSINQVTQSLPFIPEDAEIILMSVCESPCASRLRYANITVEILEEYRKKVKGDALEKINQLIEALESPRNLQAQVEIGIPYQEILDYVRKFDIDLLVLGKHPRTRLEEYLVGSTVHYAINEAECDVMITTPA